MHFEYIFFILSSVYCNGKILTFTFPYNFFYLTNFSVGNPPQNIQVPFNTALNFTWVNWNYYYIIKSKTAIVIKNDTVYIENKLRHSIQFEDSLYFNNKELIEKFYFYRIDIMSYFKSTGIGLGYKFTNDKFSFVHQLYYKGTIERKFFAFYSNGIIKRAYFGEIENNEHIKLSNYLKCKVNNKYYTWGCDIRKIIVNNVTFAENIYVTFESSNGYSVFPKDFHNYLMNSTFKEFMDDNQCIFSLLGITILYCNYYVLGELPNITFEFDGSVMNIPFAKLFICNKKLQCQSIFIIENKEMDEKGWVFGHHFFTLFNYTTFDYDKGEIGLYSDNLYLLNLYDKLKLKTINTTIRILLINAVINLFMSIILLLRFSNK